MKALLTKLFKQRAEPAPAAKPEPKPRRKYAGRPRRPVQRGAVRGDFSASLIEQSRRAWGIKR